MSALLDVENLAAAYGAVQAIDGMSLHINEQEVVAILGPNGAGKTTLLHALIGLMPSSGRVTFAGRTLTRVTPEEMVHRGMSLIPERRQLFSAMSVHDNLLLGAYHRFGHVPRSAIDDDLDAIYEMFPILRIRARDAAGMLSGGMQQMVAIGRGLMARPRLLLMDEPTLGLAPLVIQEMLKALAALKARGVALLLVEQNVRAALAVAGRGYVLEGGKVVLAGDAQMLAEHPRVRSAYLGGHVD
jgi:branched-chain amino acid transport system ATP-binding protein